MGLSEKFWMHMQAECKEGAGKVYDLLQKATISNLGWQNLSTSLVFYDQQLRLCVDTPKGLLPPFTEGDARIVEAYLKVMKKVCAICLLCSFIKISVLHLSLHRVMFKYVHILARVYILIRHF